MVRRYQIPLDFRTIAMHEENVLAFQEGYTRFFTKKAMLRCGLPFPHTSPRRHVAYAGLQGRLRRVGDHRPRGLRSFGPRRKTEDGRRGEWRKNSDTAESFFKEKNWEKPALNPQVTVPHFKTVTQRLLKLNSGRGFLPISCYPCPAVA